MASLARLLFQRPVKRSECYHRKLIKKKSLFLPIHEQHLPVYIDFLLINCLQTEIRVRKFAFNFPNSMHLTVFSSNFYGKQQKKSLLLIKKKSLLLIMVPDKKSSFKHSSTPTHTHTHTHVISSSEWQQQLQEGKRRKGKKQS